METRFKYATGVSLGLFLASVGGCSSTVDEVTNHIDCRSVCKRYADCFVADYDVDGCTDKCESRAEADADKQASLRSCDACIDGRSCTSATFNCADDCAGIVP